MTASTRYGTVDLHARAAAEGIDLSAALMDLRALYADVDARNERNTRNLALPCHQGCSACCEDSVLVTQLEFYGVWDHLQRHLDAVTLDRIIRDGLALYLRHRDVIEALSRPPPVGQVDHTRLLRGVSYRCPVLNEQGACLAYPMREMLGRLFGSSFNDERGIYGCDLVGIHLAGKTLKLVQARPMATLVHSLPLTTGQQLYPFYVHALYS